MAYVYQHLRLDTNEVFYIGIGSDDEGKYIRANNFCKTQRSKFWYRTFKKYGIKVEILFDNITWNEACEKEIELI